MQETQVGFLIQEDPTCCRATESLRHNYSACAIEPWNCNYWTGVLKLLKPECSRGYAPQRERPSQLEIHAPQLESGPRNDRKSPWSNEDSAQISKK